MYIDIEKLNSFCMNDDTHEAVVETINGFVHYLLMSPESEFVDETDTDDEIGLQTLTIKNTLIREGILVIDSEPVKPKTTSTRKKR